MRIGGLADGGLVLTSGANAFSIPVTLGGAPCADGAVVAAFDAGGTADASLGALRLEPGASAPAQGKYSGTPTFTVSVE